MGKLNPKRYKPFVRSSSPFCGVHCAQWIGAHVDVHCVAALWREYGLSGLCEVKWHCDICTNHESTQPWLPPLDCWASVCQVGLPLSLSLSLHSAVRSSHSAVPAAAARHQVRESSGLASGHGPGCTDTDTVSTDHQQPRDHASDIWSSFTTPGIDWLFCQLYKAS